MKLVLDAIPYQEKPTGPEIAALSNRLAEAPYADHDFHEVCQSIINGHSFLQSAISDCTRKKENFLSTEVIVLDFDSWTLQEFEARCREFSLTPNLVYYTFTHSPQQDKFRALFWLDEAIEGFPMWQFAIGMFGMIFPEMDHCCKNPVQPYFGGRGIHSQDAGVRTSVLNTYFDFVGVLKDRDRKHFDRTLGQIQQKLGIDVCRPKSFYGVSKFDTTTSGMQKVGKNGFPNSIYILRNPKFPTFPVEAWAIHLLDSKDGKSREHQNSSGSAGEESVGLDSPELGKKRGPVLSEQDIATLTESCQIFADYFAKQSLGHGDRFLLCANLAAYRNGLSLYRKHAQSEGDFRNIDVCKKLDYKPVSCASCAHHQTNCFPPGKNMLSFLQPRRSRFIALENRPPKLTLAETEAKLKEHFDTALNANDHRIYIIRCDTGVGKTHELISRLPAINDYAVCLPTHALKNEFVDRIETPEGVFVWPQRPQLPPAWEAKLQSLYDLELNHVTSLYEAMLKDSEVQNDWTLQMNLMEYLAAMKRVNVASRIITTHHKMFHVNASKVNTIIFDENPQNVILETDTLKSGDVLLLQKALRAYRDAKGSPVQTYLKMADYFEDHLLLNDGEILDVMHSFTDTQITEMLARLTTDWHSMPVSSPFMRLFKGKAVLCDQYHFRVLSVRDLPADKKIIILSATISEKIWKRLFGERVVYLDCGETELQGKLINDCTYSFSKFSIEANPKNLERIKALIAKYRVEECIGNESLEKSLCKDGIQFFGHYGDISGKDHFDKKVLGVFGLNHPPRYVYDLLQHYLQEPGEIAFEGREVERNGYRFEFHTPSENDVLAEFQLAHCEENSKQAVGRARLTRYPDRVCVNATNLPL